MEQSNWSAENHAFFLFIHKCERDLTMLTNYNKTIVTFQDFIGGTREEKL